jgi:hypothetical protein
MTVRGTEEIPSTQPLFPQSRGEGLYEHNRARSFRVSMSNGQLAILLANEMATLVCLVMRAS